MIQMPVGDEIFHLMRRIMQEHGGHWQQLLPQLTKPQFAVLWAVAEHPGIEQVAVTTAAAIAPATLTEMLRRLEQRGLVRREADPGDQRRRLLFLTDKGKRLLNNARPKVHQANQMLLNRLSAGDQARLQTLLQQLAMQCDSYDAGRR